MGVFATGYVNPHCQSGPRFWVKYLRHAALPSQIEFECGDIYKRGRFTKRGVLYERQPVKVIEGQHPTPETGS